MLNLFNAKELYCQRVNQVKAEESRFSYSSQFLEHDSLISGKVDNKQCC